MVDSLSFLGLNLPGFKYISQLRYKGSSQQEMAPLTRRRAAQNSSQEAQVAPPKSPVSKTKRKSAVEATEERSDSPEAESGTPKRQKLAVRVRDQVTTTKSKRNSNSEAPSTIKSKRSREALIADSAAEDSEDGEPTPRQVSKQLEEDATQQLKQELKAAAPKSKRIVFGDDNDVEKYVAAVARKAQKAQPAAPVDQEEDSDDDAPEAVSASAAVNESKRAAQALADATEK